ncbi:MAG: N-acetyltransferase [Candidatus Omnitrophica bacterium]|nr:N-acetyltransferase [Candidatus Omnitrophota bacterium]
MKKDYKIRKAVISDVPKIQNLINNYAKQGLMIARSLNELYENVRDFWVCLAEKEIIGCAAVHVAWQDLIEIKSLAVEKSYQHQGIGSQLIEECLKEAKELGAKKVFVLTYVPNFFIRFGFRKIKHSLLPHKVWADCINCPKFPNCKEIALIKNIAKQK